MKSIAICDPTRPLLRGRRPWAFSSVTLAFLVGCGAAGPGELDELEPIDQAALEATAGPEDGLADAFNTFVETFTNNNFDAQFVVGYGFHPGMSTAKVVGPDGRAASGQAILNMNTGRVTASLNNLPSGAVYDLWFVKNVTGTGRTALPETGDPTFKVGRFQGNGAFRTLDIAIGTNINFDLDLVVVTRGNNQTPVQSRIVVGERTVLEKRLFRFRQNQGLDPVTGALANNIETADPLVARGAQLFFNETFGGNGRTCGTCHRADNNLTIDPAFIAKLPQSDPLFVAENNPALAQLENPQLLRTRGLILENVDGFDDPTHKFVMRGVPHTLSLGLTNGIGNAFGGPPDHRLGWGGDGGPGRSTLQQFAFGAIMQHFTKTLARRAGVDFRLPTQEELDALEAFQLFTGRQKPVDFFAQFPTAPRAANGAQLFQGVGCTFCHDDLFGFVNGFNQNFDTGIANLTPDLILDDGFNTPGDGTFNVPPLADAADTPPFFHNNAIATIEDAVGFYFSPTFQASPSSFFIFPPDLATEDQRDIAAFLRVVNASTNLSEVRKRAAFVQTHRSPGNTDLLTNAIADARDARVVLADRNLNPAVRTKISDAETILKNAKALADNNRPAKMKQAIALLDQASAGLFTSTPPDTGGTGGSGGSSGRGGSGGSGGIPTGGTAGSSAGGTAGTSAGGTSPEGGTSAGGTSAGTTAAGGTSTAGSATGGTGGRGG